jgi:hypothetical protein
VGHREAKERAVAVTPIKGKPGKGSSKGGLSKPSQKKAKTEKYCQRCKTHGGAHATLMIPMSAVVMTRMVSPPDNSGVNRPKSISPSKKGGEKGLAYMTSMLEAIAKGQKKAAKKSRKRKKRDYDSSSDSDSE